MAETGWNDGSPLEIGSFKAGGCRPGICLVGIFDTPERDVMNRKAASLIVRHAANGVSREMSFEYTEEDSRSGRVLDLFDKAVKEAFREHHAEMYPSSAMFDFRFSIPREWPVS